MLAASRRDAAAHAAGGAEALKIQDVKLQDMKL